MKFAGGSFQQLDYRSPHFVRHCFRKRFEVETMHRALTESAKLRPLSSLNAFWRQIFGKTIVCLSGVSAKNTA